MAKQKPGTCKIEQSDPFRRPSQFYFEFVQPNQLKLERPTCINYRLESIGWGGKYLLDYL